MKTEIVNGIKIYAPSKTSELIDFAVSNPKILVALNAEKILNSNYQICELINQNIGYPDGIGAVWALKKKGLQKVIKIPFILDNF